MAWGTIFSFHYPFRVFISAKTTKVHDTDGGLQRHSMSLGMPGSKLLICRHPTHFLQQLLFTWRTNPSCLGFEPRGFSKVLQKRIQTFLTLHTTYSMRTFIINPTNCLLGQLPLFHHRHISTFPRSLRIKIALVI